MVNRQAMTRRALAFAFALLIAAAPVLGVRPALAGSGGAVGSWSSSAQAADEEAQGADAEDTFEYLVGSIPALEGVEFTIDGVTKVTNEEGKATFVLPKVDGKDDRLAGQRVIVGTEELKVDERTVARISRTLDRREGFSAVFSMFYKVAFKFIDSNKNPIPNGELESISVKSSTGEVLEFGASEEAWLLGTRVAGSARPEVKSIFWTVQDAILSRTSVVNRGQTKFNPDTDGEVVVPLLFFDTRFEIIDAFFGFHVGEVLLIEAPDGSVTELPLDSGVAELSRMPRGEYKLTVEGSGLNLVRPVAISRNQDLRLKFYTWLDVGLVLIALVLFLVVPVGVGIYRRRHRSDFHEGESERDSGHGAEGVSPVRATPEQELGPLTEGLP